MSIHEPEFELPKNIKHYLVALSSLYVKKKQKQLQEIIMKSQARVYEECDYDNWNGGRCEHELDLIVPESLLLDIVNQRDNIQGQIREDLNKLHNVQNEFFGQILLIMGNAEDQNGREESDLPLDEKRVISPNTESESRIWGEEKEYCRVFLSHKAGFRKEAAKLKEDLLLYGIASFVAHEDIHPTKEWQDEIEAALFSMDAFVALMTKKFHDSSWTDQEVGVAFGRKVPIVSVRLGKDPYGFIGKFQALSCPWGTAAEEIVKILLKQDRMLNAYIKAVENCKSYEDGNTLSGMLPFIDKFNNQQVSSLISAFNENSQVSGSFGFKGELFSARGEGLVHHLKRITGRTYELSQSGESREIKEATRSLPP